MSGPATAALPPLRFTVNGREVSVDAGPAERLLDVLRYRLGLTGTKEGCGEGECGACTVWLDGLPVDSCLVPAWQARGKRVETVESLGAEWLQPFLREGATQCGACTPGVVMTARWVSAHPELLETHSLRELMAGNLCRCTGYDGIVEGLRVALERAVGGETTAAGYRAAADPASAPAGGPAAARDRTAARGPAARAPESG